MVILDGSCGLYLSQSSPKIIPITIQKSNLVKAVTSLKEFTKSMGFDILSGLGGNKTNALKITTA